MPLIPVISGIYKIADLVQRINGPQEVQYALKATTPGNYPVMSFGSSTPTESMTFYVLYDGINAFHHKATVA